jgi:hypothetical protein
MANNPFQSAIAFILAALLLASFPARAHHSASAYDETATASVTGVVTRLQWRNPHVIIRLEVEDDDGNKTAWALETAGIQKLIADGWNKELIGPGQRLTAEIHPTKKGIPGGVLRWVTLESGQVLAIDADAPTGDQGSYASDGNGQSTSTESVLKTRAASSRDDYLARRSAIEEQEASNRPASLPAQALGDEKGALDPDNLAAHEGVAIYDFTGVWSHRSFRELSKERGGFPWDFLPVPELTPKSAAIHADVMARRAAGDATADPATFCYPHGLVRTMTRVGNMMLLQQNTALYMIHRMNNDYRAIYWDGRDHVDPSVRVDTYNGDSIAYWEDDHLYVETVGFGSAYTYINSGIPIGPQGKIEERWRLINDGNTLEIEFRMTDPEHWVGEWIDTKFWDRIYGADIREANCIVAEDAELAIGGQ